MYELSADDGGPTPRGWRRVFTEPRRPQWVRDHPHAPWLVVATVCIGAFMGQLDASIVTLAVPSIQRDFAAPLASVEWVALAYLLVLVGSVAAVGRLSDAVGRKLLYTYGFGVFTAASLACALAPSMGWLIVSRVVQALGAAMLQANSVALIRTSMPTHKLGRAIGLQGAAQAIGLALGPSIGGLLIGVGGWRLSETPVSFTLIRTPEDAAAHLFAGSPTILIDGVDAVPGADPSTDVACRIYRDGPRTAGLPSKETLRQAVLSHLGSSA